MTENCDVGAPRLGRTAPRASILTVACADKPMSPLAREQKPLVRPSSVPLFLTVGAHSGLRSAEAGLHRERLATIRPRFATEKAARLMSNELPTSDGPVPQPTEAASRPHLRERAPRNPTGRTRLSGTWVGVIIGVVVLVLLLVFVIQNTKSVKVSFLTASGNMPLGVALLLAAVGGVLLAGIVASLRIWQLRHRLHNSKRPGHRAS